ncbi:MAG: hypothetical protein KJT03_15480 [Verrucomicrobiae bacterium]|nr:hypothetical protein [Verrucomicrobiae bacterium]
MIVTPKTTPRPLARLLSILILSASFLLVVGDLLDRTQIFSQFLYSGDYLSLALCGVALGGLVLAWRWELVGGLVVLLAVALFSWDHFWVVLFPGTLVPITGLLFVLSSYASRPYDLLED